jgi:hypothetical protein
LDLLEGDTLASIVADAGAELDQVVVVETESEVRYRRGEAVFAVVHGDTLDVELGPEIAAAAARTPDTALSMVGEGWVTFRPRSLDGLVVDRVSAWVMMAWRRAAARQP